MNTFELPETDCPRSLAYPYLHVFVYSNKDMKVGVHGRRQRFHRLIKDAGRSSDLQGRAPAGNLEPGCDKYGY